MPTHITNKEDLELFLRSCINQNIELSLSKNTEYQNIGSLKYMFNDKYNEFFNFIKERMFDYTLRLLIIEIMQCYEIQYNDLIDIKESIATQLSGDDEDISKINNILNENYYYSYREINLNEQLSANFEKLNTKSNLVDYHFSSDKNSFQKLDLLSYGYLIHDLNTSFDYNAFINDLSFLYKVESKDKYLISSNNYLSYLTNTLSKEKNIFNHCINLRDMILSKDPKKDKNYARLLKSVESKYNEYIKDINSIIENNSSIYEQILLKTQFDNFLYNDFFSSLDNNLFDYLSQDIDLMYIFDKENFETLNKSHDIIKSQSILFNINFLKLMMFFNIDLNQLIDTASILEFIMFGNDMNPLIKPTRIGYSSRILLDQFFLLIFDIFWNYYTSVGDILNIIIAENTSSNSTKDDLSYLELLVDITNKLLHDKDYHHRSYSKVNITNLADVDHKKNHSLLMSYLFLSTIHQKAFYNLHFE